MEIVRNQKKGGSINEREMTRVDGNTYKQEDVYMGKMAWKQEVYIRIVLLLIKVLYVNSNEYTRKIVEIIEIKWVLFWWYLLSE